MSAARARLVRLCRSLGVPLSLEREGMDYLGDDGVVAASPFMEDEEVAHEAGHWLVAPEKFRTVRNYGLGMSPDDEDSVASGRAFRARRGLGGRDQTSTEEQCASLMGVLLEFVAGTNWEGTLDFHDWLRSDRGSTPVQDVLALLDTKGLLSTPALRAAAWAVCSCVEKSREDGRRGRSPRRDSRAAHRSGSSRPGGSLVPGRPAPSALRGRQGRCFRRGHESISGRASRAERSDKAQGGPVTEGTKGLSQRDAAALLAISRLPLGEDGWRRAEDRDDLHLSAGLKRTTSQRAIEALVSSGHVERQGLGQSARVPEGYRLTASGEAAVGQIGPVRASTGPVLVDSSSSPSPGKTRDIEPTNSEARTGPVELARGPALPEPMLAFMASVARSFERLAAAVESTDPNRAPCHLCGAPVVSEVTA